MKGKKGSKLREYQLKANEGGLCEKCGREVLVLTVDHRIPQSLLEQLGLVDEIYNLEENFSLVCQRCNVYKGHRIDMRDEKAVKILKELILKL